MTSRQQTEGGSGSVMGSRAPHDSSIGHVTGESVFIDDRPPVAGELHVGFVGSPVSAGRLKAIDSSKALQMPGVVAVFTAKDFASNRWGSIVKDQPILVEDVIGYRGEPVCVIAAESQAALNKARNLIKVEVTPAEPIYTIDEARSKNQILYSTKPLQRGDVQRALKASKNKINGVFESAGQEHFYLESQASIAYPMEGGQLEIHSSSQHPTEIQHVCAAALGLKHHQVVCIVKRMGGAFGGKESQGAPFAAMVALVAHKTRRAARIALDKDTDMVVTGKRHPFKTHYEVGFDAEGRITALHATLYADAGAYTDLSPSIAERAVFHADGSYFIENIFVEAHACRTNNHSNTAFRGFGGPQGNLIIENIIEDIATVLKKDAFEIRRKNLYEKTRNNVTHFGQVIENNLLPDIFDRLHASSNYEDRRKSILTNNARATGKLRGIAMTGCKFGISFNTRFLNQANALVNIQGDGTIQVSTGATEMGQGVNTKLQQVTADAFGLPVLMVQVMATSTEKNSNTSPTAASSGADLNASAVLNACEKIKRRLQWVAHCQFTNTTTASDYPTPPSTQTPLEFENYIFRNLRVSSHQENLSIAWKDLITKAYLNRVSLCDYGYYKTENLDFDQNSRKGRAFKYFTTGAAVSEVEIDEYTGDVKIARVDVLMDLGRPMNPGIDLGQVTGGFVQGAGWMTTEFLSYDKEGRLLSHSPTTYKIPNIQDTPRVFNVDLMENEATSENVHRTKAVGEPPLLLGASVFLAIKQALASRLNRTAAIRVPATGEEILMELSKNDSF